jgi:PAS domain S-box-containing protein
MIFYKDKGNRFLRVNKVLADIFGLPKEVIIGKTASEISPAEKDYWKDDQKVIKSGQPKYNIIEPVETPEGTRWFQTDKIPYKDSEGNTIGVIGFSIDITERKKAEEALRETEKRFHTSVENMLDCFGIYTAIRDESGSIVDFRIDYVNAVACANNNMTKEEQIGKRLLELLPAHRETGLFDKYCQVVERGKPLMEESLIYEDVYKKKHLIRAFDIRAVKLGDGFAATWRDITERKRAEQELRKNQRMLIRAQSVARMGFLTWNMITNEIQWSDEIFNIYGIDQQKVKPTLELTMQLVHPDDLEFVQKNFDMAIQGVTEYDIDHRILRLDGKVVWVHVQAELTKDTDGISFLLGTVVDITKRKQAEKALRESERRFRSLSEAAFEGICFTEKGMMVDANEAFTRICGYTLGELKGKQVIELVAPEHRELVVENIRSGYEEIYEHKGLRKDGSMIDLEVHGRGVTYQGRKMRLTAIRDITERKKAEESLKKSQSLLAETERMGKVGGWEFNIDTGKQIWTEETYNIHEVDLTYDPTVEKGVNFYTPASRPIIERAVQRAIEHGESFDVELEIMTAKGNLRSVHAIGKTDLEHHRVYGFFQDITERKRVEDERKRILEHIGGLYNSSPYPIGYAAPDGSFQDVNDAFLKMTEYTKDELVGMRRYQDITPEEYSQVEGERIEKLLRTREPQEYEKEYVRKDGSRVPVLLTVFIVRDSRGEPQSLVAIIVDMTERKKAEQALREMASFAELNPAPVLRVDRNGVILSCNAASTLIIGEDAKEGALLGSALPDLSHIDLGECVRKGLVLTRETRVQDEYYQFVICGVPKLDLVHIYGSNITERKQAEELLQAEKNKLKSMIDAMSSGITIQNLDYEIIYQNQVIIDIFGCHTSEKCYRVYETNDKVCDGCPVKMAFEDGKNHTVVREVVMPSGEIEFWENTANPIRNTQGEIISCIEVANNITERKQAEEEILMQRNKLQAMLGAMNCGVTIQDLDYSIIYQNDYIKNIFGDRLGEKCYRIYGNSDKVCDGCPVELAYKDGKSHTATRKVELPSGEIAFFENTANPIRDADGKIISCLEVGRDITKRKEVDKKLITYQNNLRSLASKLVLTEERHRQQIAANLHDNISQALALSVNQLRRLRESVASEDAETLDEICLTIEETGQSVRDLTFDLASPLLYKLGLMAAISEILDEQLRSRHGIACKFSDDKKDKPLDDNVRVLLFQAVRELLINVVKHAKAHKVEIAIQRENDNIQIIISDDGVGFDTQKAETAIQRSGGFGLFNIRERLDYSGGSFEMYSQPGSGSRFVLTAPIKTKTD